MIILELNICYSYDYKNDRYMTANRTSNII